jgi:hypothetical protein
MQGNNGAVTVNAPAPVPANLTVPGGAGYNPDAPFAVSPTTGQTVLTVGANGEFQSIGAAVAAAQNGNLILVAPGTYVNDFADITAQVTIAGAGGMVNLVATEALPNEKGIFIVDNSCQIDNITFQGAAIPDSEGGNGAGIRYQGGNLVLNNDAFLDNQNGIMGTAVDNLPQNSFTITDSTFDANGQSSGEYAGYTHNLYVGGGVTTLVATHDIFEQVNCGHEFKSRAESNLISNNIFYDGPTGTASYSIDLPDGGADTVSGNLIEKGPDTENNSIIHYGGEGIPYAGSSLLVTGNTFINDLGPQACGVLNQTTLQAVITGNTFDGFADATLVNGSYTQSGNVDQNGNAIAPSSSNDFAPGTDLDNFSADNLSHTVTFTTSGGALGGGGLLTVYADAGHVTVLGGSGGLNYQEAPNMGGSYITTAAGASDTVDAIGMDTVQAAGNDSILGGVGNLTAEIDGNDTVQSGGGSNAYTVNGTLSLFGHGGADTVQLNSTTAVATVQGSETYYQATINGGYNAWNIFQGGANEQATINGGGVVAEIYGGGMNITTAGGSAGSDIGFGTGTANLLSEGDDTVHCGSGTTTVLVGASAQVYDGTGALAVYGHGVQGEATVYGGTGPVTINGDTGNITYIGASTTGTLDAVLSNITVDGGSGRLTATGGSDQVVNGGTGGLNFTTSGGNDTITTNAAAHDTLSFTAACQVVSNGTDHIFAGSGNSTVTANGNATISGSLGNAYYVLNGQDSLVAQGYARVTVGGSAHATVIGGTSLTDVTLNGGWLSFSQPGSNGESATIKGADASLMGNPGAYDDQISLGAAGDGAALGGGNQDVVLTATATHVWAGSGDDTIDVAAGGGTIYGGSGALNVTLNDWRDQLVISVQGGGGTYAQTAGYGNLLFTGGNGTASLGGVSGSETVTAGAGNISLVGGGAGTRFVAGSGHDQATLMASGGTVEFGTGTAAITEAGYGAAVTYDFVSGHGGGNDTITGFRVGTDQMSFQGVSVASSTETGGSTLMTLTDGTQITLVGVNVAGAFAHHV